MKLNNHVGHTNTCECQLSITHSTELSSVRFDPGRHIRAFRTSQTSGLPPSSMLKISQNQQKRERQFLRSLISRCQGDNVPLSTEACVEGCKEKKVDKSTCQQLCQARQSPCPYWHKVIENARTVNQTDKLPSVSTTPTSVIFDTSRFSRTSLVRSKRSEDNAQSGLEPEPTGPTEVSLAKPVEKKKKVVRLIPFQVPEPITTPEPLHIIEYRDLPIQRSSLLCSAKP